MVDDPVDGSTEGHALPTRRMVLRASAAALTATVAGATPGQVAPALAQPVTVTVADYILLRLRQHGVKHLFGIPAKTCEPLYQALDRSDIKPVICASDLEAGYAADGYARMTGLAAVAVARGVGTLSLANAIAGAYAERSPVVLINGGPSGEELAAQSTLGVLYSHSLGELPDGAGTHKTTDLAVFAQLTAKAVRIERAADAPDLVDGAIAAALTAARPVYIEVAREAWDGTCRLRTQSLHPVPLATGNEADLARKILARLQGAHRPALLLGVELQRYRLATKADDLVRALKARYATTLLAKSVIAEDTPGFVGVHDGAHPSPIVRAAIDGSDALLTLGCVYEKLHGAMVAATRDTRMRVAEGKVWLPGAGAVDADLSALLDALLAQHAQDYHRPLRSAPVAAAAAYHPRPPLVEAGLTYDEIIAGVNGVLDASFVVMTDTSLISYLAGELKVVGTNAFVANAIWQSIGFTVGAALGVAKGGTRRPLVIVGDGGFQETCQSIATLVRHQAPAIVIVLDNGVYGIEQFLISADYFKRTGNAPLPVLDIPRWDYVALAKAMGMPAEQAMLVATPAELAAALTAARANSGPALIHARIRRHDLPGNVRV